MPVIKNRGSIRILPHNKSWKSFSLSLALLVCYCARSLASRLAWSLALAAAALLSGFLEISLVDCLNVFHVLILLVFAILLLLLLYINDIIPQLPWNFNRVFVLFCIFVHFWQESCWFDIKTAQMHSLIYTLICHQNAISARSVDIPQGMIYYNSS